MKPTRRRAAVRLNSGVRAQMKIRDKLVRLRRRYLLMLFGGMVVWGALIFGAVAVRGQEPPTWLFVAGVPIFLAIILGLLGINFLVRCPRCRGNLSRVGQIAARPLFGRSVANCPFCGVSLDAEVAP